MLNLEKKQQTRINQEILYKEKKHERPIKNKIIKIKIIVCK